MKILLDESITIRDKHVSPSYTVTKSVHAVGKGELDEKVAEYAKRNDMMLVTRDIRFALRSVMDGLKVGYYSKGYVYTLKRELVFQLLNSDGMSRIHDHGQRRRTLRAANMKQALQDTNVKH
ncbi:MAG: putative nuclease of putative toxin-antitoxin system [Candidatus Nitrosomirales archaeon]|jgi:predicted nuclease of predicted toxin-antitoxin system